MGLTAARRVLRTPVLPNLLREARGHPRRRMLLSHVLFDRVPSRRAAGPLEWHETVPGAMEMPGDDLRGHWSAIPKGQQRALRAIEVCGSPLTRAAQAAFGVTKGASRAALRAPRDQGEVEDDYELIDPPFARRLREDLGGPSSEPRDVAPT